MGAVSNDRPSRDNHCLNCCLREYRVLTPLSSQHPHRIRHPQSQRHSQERRNPLNRKKGEAHILVCHQLLCALVIPQNQTCQPTEHGEYEAQDKHWFHENLLD